MTDTKTSRPPARRPARPQPDAQLADALRMVIMRLGRRLRAERTDETLGFSEIAALASLNRHGPLSPSALSELEKIAPPSVTRVIAALEEHGLVVREAHPSDGRQTVIGITDAGRRRISEDRARRSAWLSRAIETLSEEDRSALKAVVLPLLERLNEG